jgi:trimeric autotransporter adhesin
MTQPSAYVHSATGARSASGPIFPAGASVARRTITGAALLALALGCALSVTRSQQRVSLPAASLQPRIAFHPGWLGLPLAAQGPVSAVLGANDPTYTMTASAGFFGAANPAQRLQERFSASGAVINNGKMRLGLSLRAVGYGGSVRALAPVSPTASANRVTYTYPDVQAWYANGPLGLEQGFTIVAAPSPRPAGLLTLSIAMSGNAHVSLASRGQSLTLSRAGAPSLLYTGLSTTDAGGRPLRSWLELSSRRLLLRVDARGARYPLRIDPFVAQAKLKGGGETKKDGFGFSAALSSDGNTALIGAPYDGNFSGAAWVFTRSGETWAPQGGKLTGSGEGAQGQFGTGVALSADGNTALIVAPDSGAAWVFKRSGSTWTQQGGVLTGTGFGRHVALSGDGNTALLSAPYDNNNRGAAWVFTRSGETWSQQEKITAGESGDGYFGWAVALSSDGNTAVIGSLSANMAAAVYTRSGTTWTKQAELPHSNAVSVSADGNTALIGEYFESQALIYIRSGSTWKEQAKFTSNLGDFGETVALSPDGNTALIGHLSGIEAFTRSGETWTQPGEQMTASGSEGSAFGFSAAVSGEGGTVLVGDPNYKREQGAAWVLAQCIAPRLVVATTSLPEATRGTGYGAQLVARCGIPPYKWKKAGALPAGLKVSKTGVLSGVPSTKLAPGSYSVRVGVTDSERPKNSATATLMLKIN